MTPGFRLLLNRFAMIQFERQLALQDLLGDHDWELELREGRASFGEGRTYRLHLLGSVSSESNTWLWAWAQDAKKLSPGLLDAAKKVKAVGKKRSAGELEVEELKLEQIDPHILALVATGVAELPAYYRFPYAGGALYAAIDAPVTLGEPDVARIAKVVTFVVERMELDDRAAFEGYVRTRGAKVDGAKDEVVARWPDGRGLVAKFDADGRLAELRSAGGAGAESRAP